MDKAKLFKGFWNEKICDDNPSCMFIFGDNDISKGCGGQAIIRYCSNAYGIPTKKVPTNHDRSFYTDDEYETNKKKIMFASKDYDIIYFPEDGFGMGLAKLKTKAPKTYIFLNYVVEKYFGISYAKNDFI